MNTKNTKRRGVIAVMAALLLTAIVGYVAVVAEGGLIQHNRRISQTVADAAAFAGAETLYANYQNDNGLDTNHSAADRAKAIASANGYTNDLVNTKVTVNVPPTSGLFSGQAGYIEVLVEKYQPRGFSNLFGSGPVTIKARSVARGQWKSFSDGIIVLNPTLPGSLNSNGGGVVTVLNSDIIVDSNAANAAIATGGGTLTAQQFNITGVPGTSTSGGGQFNGTINSGQVPTPDPLAYIPAPDPSTMTVQSTKTITESNKTIHLDPGVYIGGIKISGQASVVMSPGIYYMKNGGFEFTGQGNLTALGVMVYTAPGSNSDNISISGTLNAKINYSPMTTGIYRGIALWQERTSTNTIAVSGNGGTTISGTFYTQHGQLKVTGNGTSDVLGSQYISDTLNLGGNGNFFVNWQQDITPRGRILQIVE